MSGRSEIVARARVLSGGDLGPRARRLAQRLGSASSLSFDDVAASPGWILWAQSARRDLARAAGVGVCASQLRRTIDGQALRIFAEAVGAERLDALLASPAFDCQEPRSLPRDMDALSALGAAALRSEFADRPDLARRLADLLPASTETLDPATARAACAQARQWAAIDGEAQS